MSYHVTNYSHVIDHFLRMLRLLALHVLRCVLLEIALNAGSACVGRRPVADWRYIWPFKIL